MAQGGLQYNFARLNIAEKLIAINVLIFILDGLALALLGVSVSEWFHLPKILGENFWGSRGLW